MLQTRAMMFSALVVSGLAVSATSAATVGPGTAFGGSGVNKAYGLGSTNTAAVSFVVPVLSSPFSIQSLDVAMRLISGSGTFSFSIVTDVPGVSTGPDLSATPAATFSLASSAFPDATNGHQLATTLVGTPASDLISGVTYWLVGSGSANVSGNWLTNSEPLPNGAPGNVVGFSSIFGAYTDTRAPAFLLSGTSPIPLPASSMMGGALVLGLLVRRKH